MNEIKGEIPEPTTLRSYDTGTGIYTDFSPPPPVDAWQKCPVCEGEGQVPCDFTIMNEQCPTCKGKRIISTATGKPPEDD